jgi:hypothetical protein
VTIQSGTSFDGAGYARDDLLSVAGASPEAVARHDKQAWLSLFSEEAVVEDPVGATPVRCVIDRETSSRDSSQLERFYETFIASNDIVFQVHNDIVAAGMVARDATIEITSSTWLTTSVHIYVLYELVEEDGRLKIARLAAHWELFNMVRQVTGRGWPGFKMMTVLGFRMLRFQGFSGILSYMRGFSGIGREGKDAVLKFMKGVNERDVDLLSRLVDSRNDEASIEFPVGGRTFSPASLVDEIDAQVSASDLISAGWVIAFQLDITSGQDSRRGIGLFEFTPKTRKIKRARFFWD